MTLCYYKMIMHCQTTLVLPCYISMNKHSVFQFTGSGKNKENIWETVAKLCIYKCLLASTGPGFYSSYSQTQRHLWACFPYHKICLIYLHTSSELPPLLITKKNSNFWLKAFSFFCLTTCTFFFLNLILFLPTEHKTLWFYPVTMERLLL